ncbi:MAG TPA: hypothetical protein V6C72_03725 [Chroococcales cyanobacterium]
MNIRKALFIAGATALVCGLGAFADTYERTDTTVISPAPVAPVEVYPAPAAIRETRIIERDRSGGHNSVVGAVDRAAKTGIGLPMKAVKETGKAIF